VGARREFSGIMAKPWRMVTLHVGAWIALALLWSAKGIARFGGLTALDWTCLVVIAGCVQTGGCDWRASWRRCVTRRGSPHELAQGVGERRVPPLRRACLGRAGGGWPGAVNRHVVFKKDVRSIWATYRSCSSWHRWCWEESLRPRRRHRRPGVGRRHRFKEFARATGLYRDWWMTGAVYLGIAAVV